jgi:multidrug transporter EmrE-like cation transporter
MDYPLHNVIGNLGVIMIVGSYFLVQIGKMSAIGLSYTSLNGIGAAFIMVSLYFDFNLSAFIIEVFWILISLVGMVRIYLQRRRKTAS